MRNYQQKKKGLSKQVFEILEARGYLFTEEIRRNIQSGEYRTTLATNFNTITLFPERVILVLIIMILQS